MMLQRKESDVSMEEALADKWNAWKIELPRLSAAMTMPSLNFTARTDVPVTMGCWVWVWG